MLTEPGIIPRKSILELKKDVPRFYLDEKVEIEKKVDGKYKKVMVKNPF